MATGKAAKQAKNAKPQQKKAIGFSCTMDQWNAIVSELQVFKGAVVNTIVDAVNKNSSPIFADDKK